uniref:Uncharacterized protein n=1 Tax=Quercus lobata TaxID=97700 RepID=A0A7N2N2X7_QUELO
MDELSSRWLSKVPCASSFRPWCLYFCNIYNRVLGRTQKQLHSLVDLSDHVMLHFGGNSGIHSIGAPDIPFQILLT